MKTVLRFALLAALVFVIPRQSKAVPSFARQTGMSCSVCHTVFPELTSFGRNFKMSGYTLGVVKKISETKGEDDTRLSMSDPAPLSAMIQVSHSLVATQIAPPNALPVTAGSDGYGSIQFPAQFSLFYAGALSPKLGTFIQATYDSDSGVLHLDNTDIRYVNKVDMFGTELILGVDLNNNPTVQDVWNTVPAWGYPYATSDLAVKPAATQIDQSLGSSVASLGAYLYWNSLVYAEISAYRSAPQGGGQPPMVIQGFAPYWRVALQQDFDNHSVELGTFGLGQQTLSSDPANFQSNPADTYTDYAFDAQYQYVGENHIFTAQGIWINEAQDYNGMSVGAPYPVVDPSKNPAGTPSNASNTLQTLRITGTYYYQRMLGCTVGYFGTQGSTDAGLYPGVDPANPSTILTGSASGSPNSNGYVFELNYLPWLNTKFSLQYTDYLEFNGGTTNYNGSDRNAADNNTTMLMAWLMY